MRRFWIEQSEEFYEDWPDPADCRPLTDEDIDRAQRFLDAVIDNLHGPGLIIDVRFVLEAALGNEAPSK